MSEKEVCMKYLIIVTLAFFLLSGSSTLEAFKDKTEKKIEKVVFTNQEFKAKVRDVRLNTKLIEAGKKQDDFVTVKLSAMIFKQSIVIEDVRKNTRKDLPEVMSFFTNYIKANLEGTAEEIAAFWSPELRKKKLALLKKYFDVNRKMTKRSPGLTVIGIVKHSDNALSLLKTTSKSVMGINLIKKDGKLFLVDDTKHDLDLAFVEASFR
jgi:hypothetical protein